MDMEVSYMDTCSVPTEGLAEDMAGIFLAYLGYSMEAGVAGEQ